MATTITVEGMSRKHCEQTVEEALQGVAGVSDLARTEMQKPLRLGVCLRPRISFKSFKQPKMSAIYTSGHDSFNIWLTEMDSTYVQTPVQSMWPLSGP
jgi:cation transport ATPase